MSADRKDQRHSFTVHADGEPNFYTILRDQNWFARVQFNGELTVAQQEAFVAKLMEAAR